MDEITFGDVLTHYKNKIQEYTEQITDIRLKLKKIDAIAEGSWNGNAAVAFKNKLNEQIAEINKILTDFSDVTSMLAITEEDYYSTLEV